MEGSIFKRNSGVRSADRPQIFREERRLAGPAPHLIAADVEAAQPVNQLPRDLADRYVAPVSVGIGKASSSEGVVVASATSRCSASVSSSTRDIGQLERNKNI